MKTTITDTFGIDVPIIAFTHCRDVVVAVTKAGGMGVLGAAGHSDRQLEIDLDWIEDEIGDRPYGVDLIVPAKYAGSDEGGLTMATLQEMIPPGHRAFVDDILDRYDVPELPADAGSGGNLVPSAWAFSDSQAQNRASLVALDQRLRHEGVQVRAIVPAHSAVLTDGLAQLDAFAQTSK